MLLGVAGLRQAQILDTSWTIALIGVSPVVLLLALPLGIVAVFLRRWVLTAVCLGVLACWGCWAGPDLWPVAHPGPSEGPSVRLFDANVSQSNHDLTAVGAEIVRDDPEVIVLEEISRVSVASLRRTGALAPYRWHVIRPDRGPNGLGLWSRIPATGLRVWSAGENQNEIDGWLHPPGVRPIRIDGVHVYAPAFGPDQPAVWRRQLAAVRAHLAREPRPLVVAGDFNATWDLLPFQRIMHLGLSDAAVEEGRGWQMTWPRNQAWVLPYLRIDHVLYSPQLTVTSYRLGTGRGSDHHPLLVSIAAARR